MKNVYCGHCRYYRRTECDMVMISRWAEECHHPSNMRKKSDHRHEWMDPMMDPYDRNAHNKCRGFAPKWHKRRKYRWLVCR